MIVRQRVLEARLAEKAGRNPTLAKQMGIVINYHNTSNDGKKTRRYLEVGGNVKTGGKNE